MAVSPRINSIYSSCFQGTGSAMLGADVGGCSCAMANIGISEWLNLISNRKRFLWTLEGITIPSQCIVLAGDLWSKRGECNACLDEDFWNALKVL